MKNKFPLNFHLVFERDLPENSFLVNGIEHDVPCVFQIWENRATNRAVSEKIEPVNFFCISLGDNCWCNLVILKILLKQQI